MPHQGSDRLVDRLRAAGCVFAVAEAAVLRRWARDDAEIAGWVERRLCGEPLEQIVGRVRFGRLDLAVGPGAFVPRRRSQLLARVAVDQLTGRAAPVFIEAYCGVAPLAAHVRAARPEATVVAIDADPVALGYAEQNVGVAAVFRGRVLSGLPWRLRGTGDVIAAVPPYVPDAAVDLLPHEAREYEPRTALLGGVDGLDAVRALLGEAPRWLRRDGVVAVEVNATQTDSAADAARAAGLTATRVDGDDGQTSILVARPVRL